jgi:hypothetical protein
MSEPADPQARPDPLPAPELPDVESPPRDDVLERAPSKEEVVEQAPSADEVIAGQPSVDEILGRDS